MKEVIIGIDIGGTNIKAAVMLVKSLEGIIEHYSYPTKENGKEILKQVKTIINFIINKYRSKFLIKGIAIATAGIVDFQKGEIINANDNIPGWIGIKLKDSLEKEFLLPVVVENDVNAAAWGEYLARNKRFNNFIGLTIGTGIGGGIIYQGRIMRGSQGKAGEIGYMIISDNGSTLETYVSRKGILRAAGKYFTDEEIESLTVKDIFNLASAGDKRGIKIVNQTVYYLALGLKNLIYIFDPEIIVLGGGIAQSGEILLNTTKKFLFEYGIKENEIALELAILGNKAGLVGIKDIFRKKYIVKNNHYAP